MKIIYKPDGSILVVIGSLGDNSNFKKVSSHRYMKHHQQPMHSRKREVYDRQALKNIEMQSTSRFLKVTQVFGRAATVLIRMSQGDQLVEYAQRKFLHSVDPQKRPSIEVKSNTICSLMAK